MRRPLIRETLAGRNCNAERDTLRSSDPARSWRVARLDEAERICASASDIVSNTESRVSQLWLGPLYMDVLIAAAEHLKNEDKTDEAATKLKSARELLETYLKLAADCQSPRFKREAARLEQELKVAD